MRRIVIAVVAFYLLLPFSHLNAQSGGFCRGFAEGWMAVRGELAIVPICPIEPITPIGSTPYREGIKAGVRAGERAGGRNTGGAAEHGDVEITKLYDEFNAELKRIGPKDPDALNRFYTKAHRAANRCSFFDSNCRMSARIFDEVITLTKYEIVSIETNADGSVDLMVLGNSLGTGNSAEGVEVGLVVKWMFEEGRWRIGSIMKGPPDRDWLKRRFSIKELRPKPITPRD